MAIKAQAKTETKHVNPDGVDGHNLDQNSTQTEDERLQALMNADNSEWEVVADESPNKVILDTPGDFFIGVYEGTYTVAAENNITREHPEGEAFTMFLFRGLDGKPYSMNQSAKLVQAMEAVEIGTKVRIELIKEIQTKNQLNPMKDYKVLAARK